MTAPQQPPYPQFAPPGCPTPPPPRKRHVGRWVLMIVGGLFVIIIAAAVSHPTPPGSPTTTPAVPAGNQSAPAPAPASQAPTAPAVHHVVYKITESVPSTASITFNSDGAGSLQQETDAKVPAAGWTKEFDFPADQVFAIAQVSAQNGGGGKITCEIDVDGKVAKAGTASGEYAIASCNATIQ